VRAVSSALQCRQEERGHVGRSDLLAGVGEFATEPIEDEEGAAHLLFVFPVPTFIFVPVVGTNRDEPVFVVETDTLIDSLPHAPDELIHSADRIEVFLADRTVCMPSFVNPFEVDERYVGGLFDDNARGFDLDLFVGDDAPGGFAVLDDESVQAGADLIGPSVDDGATPAWV